MNEVKKGSDCPELDYFMNESLSDVVFIIEGKRLPARKELLIIKNRVFRAMFSKNFKEGKDKEVVIEVTTFKAFKTLIQFLYCDQLVLKDSDDFVLIEEVCRLADRYEANRLMKNISKKLIKFDLTFDNIEWISRIGFRYKTEELMANVMSFIVNNFSDIIAKDVEECKRLNDSTDGHLFKLMADNYLKVTIELDGVMSELKEAKNKLAQLELRRCMNCGRINDSVPNFLASHCVYCGKQRISKL